MAVVAQSYDFVVGIDTHSRTHTLAIISTLTGAEIANDTFPSTNTGMNRALRWISRRSTGDNSRVLLSMEGTGSYGAKFRQLATESDYRVIEAPFPERRVGRKRGKSDSIDAARAARAVLGIETDELREPRAGQHHMALRVLTVARTSMVRERTAAINSLIALLRVVDLGIDLRKSLNPKTIGTVAAWRTRDEGVGTRVSRSEATRLAKQILALEDQLEQNRADMALLVEQTNQALLDMPGVGPISAAAIPTAWSHPGRVRSEAALAALAGTCPIPASSGGKTRYRLNRGGDRQLNKAIHTIAIVRMRSHQDTREYVIRRTREGRNKKEIIRSLKRYITRQIFRTLSGAHEIPGGHGIPSPAY
ncbi:transposase [Arthrobacter sp. SLBN-112]|uniref:IS110 family transposase n=1 Tax=Arthrobacter sp. SLBN-112 TaxID=2768452 RepID=UPI0011509F00|nr:IS110 family transposase [Arthrobacter sp. SLBN-112]TQJ39374.1 transposase [Arthrobacter sp. SLBN-112]